VNFRSAGVTTFQTSKDLVFTGGDLLRPRMTVEQEKVNTHFPGFSFYATQGRLTSIKGYLRTSYGGSYYVSIQIPPSYPYEGPTVLLPYETIDSGVHHKFSSHEPCLMKADQWSSSLSIAFIIAKTAIWVNKYDSWKRTGQWPGTQQ